MEAVNAIELKGVTKRFGDVIANDNVNLTVRKGEILSILGENGSGKTTLMNMLSGIYFPDEGEIRVDGKEVTIRSPKDSFALGIGMIHQHFKLINILTAAENIILGLPGKEKLNMKQIEKEMLPAKNPLYGKHAKNLMKTDVRETDDSYEVDIDLPGFKKDEVTAQLNDGYITISAAKGLDKDEKDTKTGKYIRKERYAGSLSRSFYVGENLTQDEISAKFENGILQLTIPKKDAKAVEGSNFISIEG